MKPYTPEEEALLHNERLISELLKLRSEASTDKPDKPKQRLEVLASSTVLAAAVTVLGTAIAGWLISGSIQDRSKKNELELQAKRDYLAAQVEVDSKAYDIVGRYVSAADDLITLTRPRYRSDFYNAWKNEIIKVHDAADSEWRGKNRTIGHLLSYHHYGQANVAEIWKALVSDIRAFETCASRFFKEHSSGATEAQLTPRPCSDENEKIEAQLERFRSAIEAGRPMFWNKDLEKRE